MPSVDREQSAVPPEGFARVAAPIVDRYVPSFQVARHWLMEGVGASGTRHTWIATAGPDFGAVLYAGGDTPLTAVRLVATW